MGFWHWLTGKPNGVEVVDWIWTTQEAKLQGLCKEAQEQHPAAPAVLTVAHFPVTLDRLKSELKLWNMADQVRPSRLSPADFLRAVNGVDPATLMLIRADALVPDEFPNPVVDELPPFSIMVAERHFLRSYDDRIVDFARSLGRRCQVSFHLSLRDPLLQIFAKGEWVEQMLRGLGMTDTKPIESVMVARRLARAQAKLAKQVISERNASSAEEWCQWNVPGRA